MPLLITLLVLKSLLWVAVVPVWMGPDEPLHFAYVQYMAEVGRIPVVGPEDNGSSLEQRQFMNLEGFHSLAKMGVNTHISFSHYLSVLGHEARTHTTHAERVSSGSNPASGYPPLYYWLAALVYRLFEGSSIVWRFYAVRLLSSLMGIVATLAAYKVGLIVFRGSRRLALVATSLVALQPMSSFVFASVNNDVALDMCTALALWWVLDTVHRQDLAGHRSLSWPRALVGSLILGLGLLCKAEMLYVDAAVIALLLIRGMRATSSRRAFLTKVALGLILPAVVVYLPWAFFSFAHYHSVLGAMGFQSTGDPHISFVQAIRQSGVSGAIRLWVLMYWADFGSLNVTFPEPYFKVYVLLGVLMVGAVVGTIAGIARRPGPSPIIRRDLALYLLIFVVGDLAFLYLVDLIYYNRYHVLVLQGRYLLTSVIPISILLIYGWSVLLGKKAGVRASTVAITALLAVLNLGSLALIGYRYFHGL